jgi:hypothetical protein
LSLDNRIFIKTGESQWNDLSRALKISLDYTREHKTHKHFRYQIENGSNFGDNYPEDAGPPLA